MAAVNLADLFDEYNEIKGEVIFKPNYKRLSDKNFEQIIICDKKVGHSHFSLVRNQDFEIIFTHQNGYQTHQSRLDLNTYQPVYENNILLNWGPDHCELRWDFNPNCCELGF